MLRDEISELRKKWDKIRAELKSMKEKELTGRQRLARSFYKGKGGKVSGCWTSGVLLSYVGKVRKHFCSHLTLETKSTSQFPQFCLDMQITKNSVPSNKVNDSEVEGEAHKHEDDLKMPWEKLEDKEEIQIDEVSSGANSRGKRAATARKDRLWDYGIIPYDIEANFTGQSLPTCSLCIEDNIL